MAKFDPTPSILSASDCRDVQSGEECAAWFGRLAVKQLMADGEITIETTTYRLVIKKEEDPNSCYADLCVQDPAGRAGDPLRVSFKPVIEKIKAE